MAWKKVNEIPAHILIQIADALDDNTRVVWKDKTSDAKINFLATGKTLIEMLLDTTDPDDMFEIWYNEDLSKSQTEK